LWGIVFTEKQYNGLCLMQEQEIKYLPLFVFVCVLSACTSVRYMSVETYNPATVTFPPDIRKVLIVDNTVPQPQVPFTLNIMQAVDTMNIASDHVANVFCRTLGEMIVESPYFEDVLLYEGRFRTDSSGRNTDSILTPENVGQLCEEQDADAVISLDRLLFEVHEAIRNMDDYGLSTGIFLDATISGILRTYLPGRRTPLDVIYLSDTVYSCIVPSVLEPFTPEDIRNALTAAFEGLAEKYHPHFVPHWNDDIRWYYVSSAARNKEAAAFMAAGKWENAAAIWELLYDATASQKTKARMASNMALCCEMIGDFLRAVKWAELACQHLMGHPAGNDHMFGLQKEYLSVLTCRIEAEKKLREQEQ
jgi:hypothetical protein